MHIRLLGPVEVWSADRLVDVGPPRQRCVLAALAVDAGRPVSIGTVVDRVWGEDPPDRARHALYVYIARLRRVLETTGADTATLVRRGRGYLLDVSPDAVDVYRFRALAERAQDPHCPDTEQARLLQQALDLWRGPPLADLPGEWVVRTREGWQRQRMDAVVAWAQAQRRLGDAAATIGPLSELATEYPYAEQLVAALMRALHATGRSAEALERYAEVRRRLVEELGADPGVELQGLQQAILRGELDQPLAAAGPAPGPPVSEVPAQLPLDVRGFAGRAGELAALDAVLAEADAQPTALVISAVTGSAGVGKTALAVHWAHRVADRFPDGQLYVNLNGFAPTPPLRPIEALAYFLPALGLPADQVPVDLDRAAALYRSLLAGRRMLIVLDNAGGAEQVRPLLPGSPGCLVLVTSRDRLSGLTAREGARRLSLDVLSPDESADLLARVLGADRVAAEPVAAADLARVCAHLPLALRIAAAHLLDHPQRSIAGQVTELDRKDRLAALEVDGDPQSAVPLAFDLSYATLEPAAQRLFRLLGLVPGPDATPAVAAALLGEPPDRAAPLLDRLAAAHLIGQPAPHRYAFHDLLRLHAADRARREDGPAECAAAVARLLDWYLDTADAATRLLYPQVLRLPRAAEGPAAAGQVPFGTDTEALAWFDAERANLTAAVQYAAEHGPRPAAWLLADLLRGYFWENRHMVDWLAVANAAVVAATAAGDLLARAAAQRHLGQARQCLGDYARAAEHHTTAMLLARQAGWAQGEAAAASDLGTVHADLGQLEPAAEHQAQALASHRKTGHQRGQAVALVNLGDLTRQMGRLDQTVAHLSEALLLCREIGAVSGQAAALGTLGEAYRDLGRLDDAEASLTEALALAREVGHRYGEAADLAALGIVQLARGRLAPAAEHTDAALALAREIGEPRMEADALNAAAEVQRRLGRHVAAVEQHRRALTLARQTSTRYPEIESLVGLAGAHRETGQHAEAAGYAQQAVSLAGQAGYRMLEGQALDEIAAIHLAAGHHARAAEYASRAVAVHEETGHRLGTARALVVLGHTCRHAGDPAAARRSWQRALGLLTAAGAAAADEVRALLVELPPDDTPTATAPAAGAGMA